MKNLKIICAAIILVTLRFSLTGQDLFPRENYTEPVNVPLIESRKEEFRSKHVLEVSHGQAFVDVTDSWAWLFSGNYLYRFNRNIAAGGGAGLQLDWTGVYPAVSLNSVFGNKSESFAAGIDLRYWFTRIIETPEERIWFTVGAYYKNFFIKVMPTFIFGYPEEWYFETGYSFDIGDK